MRPSTSCACAVLLHALAVLPRSSDGSFGSFSGSGSWQAASSSSWSTSNPTPRPTAKPTASPSTSPTAAPTASPTAMPSTSPTEKSAVVVSAVVSITNEIESTTPVGKYSFLAGMLEEAKKRDALARVEIVSYRQESTFKSTMVNVNCSSWTGKSVGAGARVWAYREATRVSLGILLLDNVTAAVALCARRRRLDSMQVAPGWQNLGFAKRQLRATGNLQMSTSVASDSDKSSLLTGKALGADITTRFAAATKQLPTKYSSAAAEVQSEKLPAASVSGLKYKTKIVTKIVMDENKAAVMSKDLSATGSGSKILDILQAAGVSSGVTVKSVAAVKDTVKPTRAPTRAPTLRDPSRSVIRMFSIISATVPVHRQKFLSAVIADSKKKDKLATCYILSYEQKASFLSFLSNVPCMNWQGAAADVRARLWMFKKAAADALSLQSEENVTAKVTSCSRRRRMTNIARRQLRGALTMDVSAVAFFDMSSSLQDIGSKIAPRFQTAAASLPPEFTEVLRAMRSETISAPKAGAIRYLTTIATEISMDKASASAYAAELKTAAKVRTLLATLGVSSTNITQLTTAVDMFETTGGAPPPRREVDPESKLPLYFGTGGGALAFVGIVIGICVVAKGHTHVQVQQNGTLRLKREALCEEEEIELRESGDEAEERGSTAQLDGDEPPLALTDETSAL